MALSRFFLSLMSGVLGGGASQNILPPGPHLSDKVKRDHWTLGDEDAIHCFTNTPPFETLSLAGIRFEWAPGLPVPMFADEETQVGFTVTFNNEFWQGNSLYNSSELEDFRSLCASSTPCPSVSERCCVNHANLHSCRRSVSAVCNPWVAPSEDEDGYILVTHTPALVGGKQAPFVWTMALPADEWITIAHARFSRFQCAIGAQRVVVVRPRKAQTVVAILSTGGSLIAVFSGVFVVWSARQQVKRRRELYSSEWIVDAHKVQLLEGSMELKRSKVSVATGNDSMRNIHGCSVCLYENERYVQIPLTYRPTLTVMLREQVYRMRQAMKHTYHLNGMGGLVWDSDEKCFTHILWQTPGKGTLDVVLDHYEDIIDWTFRYSFARDVIGGLEVIHQSPLRCWGTLSLQNCFVDSRWSVRLNGYGLDPDTFGKHSFIEQRRKSIVPQKMSIAWEGLDWERQYYLAPEVLRGNPPTAASDVWSLGVILYEIATGSQGNLYSHLKLDPLATLKVLSEGGVELKFSEVKDAGFIELIAWCLKEDPTERPTLQHLRRRLRQVSPLRDRTLTDTIIKMLEESNKNLDRKVEQRTEQLVLERERNFEIVCSMVPRKIAEKLRDNIFIEPERFSTVALFFSDVCGFTRLASTLDASNIIQLLQCLFGHFDDIIINVGGDEEGLYKVETIGDCYVAASGVPTPVSNACDYILRFALEASKQPAEVSNHTSIPFQIRIGLHCGPLVAGVIGTHRNPRYNLFGDTMNTASRMESTSEPGRIQCSEAFYNHVIDRSHAHFETRGTIEVKGKGAMTTYWVTQGSR